MDKGYEWTITVDKIDGGDVGVCGPRGALLSAKEIREHPDRQEFKMYSDDGELYYRGFLIGGGGFEPLDDFGAPNAGCTYIKYRDDDGEWSIL